MKRRKVLVTCGTSSYMMLIITDVPPERIEHWCRRYNRILEDGIYVEPFDTLMTQYYVKILHDSEVDDPEDVEIIGYDEVYDLNNY